MSETALWSAVLRQAIEDAIQPAHGSWREKARTQREAIAYLTPSNRDFQQVCFLAGLDPNAVYEGFVRMAGEIELIDPHQAKRAPRKRGKLHSALGQTLSLTEWSTRTGIPYAILYTRLQAGWSIHAALTTAHTPGKRPTRPATKEPEIA